MRQIFLKLVRFGQELRDTRQREERQVLLAMGADDSQRREIEGILRVLEGKTGRLLVASEEEGKAIVSGSDDKTVRLWRVGTWEDWLAVCCNRLRHHPIFKDPPDEVAREACAVCQRLVWDKENV